MKEIALHILDVVQNSVRAGATEISIIIIEDTPNNLLKITIEDDGKGMSKNLVSSVKNPFVTSRTLRKVGLGIPLLNQLCEECAGGLSVESTLGKGTKLIATMQYNHIDRLPIGDMPSTMTTLILSKPEIEYIYQHSYNDHAFLFDTKQIKTMLEGVPIHDLEIIKWIGNYLQENIEEIHQESI
ncbi:ATP-binding protein [Cellulosilyticum sp. I15G10I2]|uniref:ATP-binding protein n=1 Tax=Cellulosilyticum sp. I15G10I2 TaxID=1892843 RepID=UPI00085C896C|nr:ATP-binding protein [Cellulosilyticum sp. I15G10I2]